MNDPYPSVWALPGCDVQITLLVVNKIAAIPLAPIKDEKFLDLSLFVLYQFGTIKGVPSLRSRHHVVMHPQMGET